MTTPKPPIRTAGAVALAVLVLAATATAPAAAGDAEPSFVVALEPDGSARVVVTITFDLESDAERDAFGTLRDDEAAREDVRVRFRDRLGSVANDAAEATGREMAVADVTVDITTTADNRTGIATLSATWEGLAAVEADRIVVTEPFASGFAPDGRFVLRAPEGYAVIEATPPPATRNGMAAEWGAGTDLDGFRAVVTPAPTATPAPSSTPIPGSEGATGTGAPGFGIGIGFLALLVAAGVAATRGR